MDHQLDGTLAPAFFHWLEQTRQKREVVWIINTGRTCDSLEHELERRHAPIWPDWFGLIERHLYKVDPRQKSATPIDAWNDECNETHQKLFEETTEQFDKMRETAHQMEGVDIISDTASPLGIITHTEELADEFQEIITPILAEHPDLITIRNSVYFRFAHQDYHKGALVKEVARLKEIPVENCFSAGDHFNDLHMLCPEVSGCFACPSNSAPEVKDHVRNNGGFVADDKAHYGVVQALLHYFG